jgi:hypothetical protein
MTLKIRVEVQVPRHAGVVDVPAENQLVDQRERISIFLKKEEKSTRLHAVNSSYENPKHKNVAGRASAEQHEHRTTIFRTCLMGTLTNTTINELEGQKLPSKHLSRHGSGRKEDSPVF